MIGIVDLGLCNVGSVQNMLRKIGQRSRLVRAPEEFASVDRIILPGVGHFARAMARLRETGFDVAIRREVAHGKPILGICLGMQLLGSSSEEGEEEGLGLIRARFIRFRPERANARITIPHMGWNSVVPVPDKSIARGVNADTRFYFVHSYHAEDVEPGAAAMTASHGYPFVCAYQKGHVAGVQFHPEKSHAFGKIVFANFAEARAYA